MEQGGAAPDGSGFCSADNVPKATAAALGRWAAARLTSPPAEKLGNFIEIQITKALGMHALARRDYCTGDLLLSEKALLRIPELQRDLRSRLERRFGERAAFLSPAAAVDWKGVSKDEVEAALSLFWAHPIIARPGSSLAKENQHACMDLKEWHEPLKDVFSDEKDLMKFLHIVDLNIHKDDEVDSNRCFTGIFVLGSKFSHSCAPNAAWSFSGNGELQYHAIRPIKKGELFTFSYVGNGMNLITSTLDRRMRLSTLWFICQCQRCTGPDLSRQMRCPRCKAPQCLPCYRNQESAHLNWTGDCALRELVVDAKEWRCAACSSTSPAAEMPLQAEEELGNLVPQAMQGPPERADRDAAMLAQLRKRAAETVGTSHWVYALATFATMQKALIQLRMEPTLHLSEARLRKASAEVARWLQTCAPDGAEQRLSALFISTRLAHNLGGGLKDWGYSQDDPLGGGLQSAQRLADHGWVLQQDAVRCPDDDLAGVPRRVAAQGRLAVHSGPLFTGGWRPF